MENDSELVASHELVKTSKNKNYVGSFAISSSCKKHTSVVKELSDRSGIRTHASEDTAAVTQRLGPFDHTACKNKYRPTFAFAQGQHPLSRVSLELFALCNLLFHGFYLW